MENEKQSKEKSKVLSSRIEEGRERKTRRKYDQLKRELIEKWKKDGYSDEEIKYFVLHFL
ncbi:MAG: hypothetical protein GX335_07990 [Firmicutes bacterium]|nr:hypothetical protein [Bacillota bacterium]